MRANSVLSLPEGLGPRAQGPDAQIRCPQQVTVRPAHCAIPTRTCGSDALTQNNQMKAPAALVGSRWSWRIGDLFTCELAEFIERANAVFSGSWPAPEGLVALRRRRHTTRSSTSTAATLSLLPTARRQTINRDAVNRGAPSQNATCASRSGSQISNRPVRFANTISGRPSAAVPRHHEVPSG